MQGERDQVLRIHDPHLDIVVVVHACVADRVNHEDIVRWD